MSEEISSQNVNSSNNVTGRGVDYQSGRYTVAIPAGQTRAPFDIQINDDNILEDDEDFMLTIIPSSLPDGVTRGTPGQVSVTIIDNDRKYLGIYFQS